MNNKGKIIVFEGLDYSFKETNSISLYNYIKDNITDKVLRISFPKYENESSLFVKKYLNGDYGKSSEINPYQASLYYAIDRANTIILEDILEKYNNGWYIIFDRYTGSNEIFQSSKISDINEKHKFIEWCEDLEYDKLKLPKPDITIYLNMPVEVSSKLIHSRKLKNNQNHDGHEDNTDFMKTVEKSAILIANKLSWNIVNCTDKNKKIYNKNYIFNNIMEILEKYNIVTY